MTSKFKTIGELEKAYTELEKAFTKKCQENKVLRDVLDKLKFKGASASLISVMNDIYEPVLESNIGQTRRQVCEEIREYCKNNFIPIPNKLGCYVEVNREEFFDNLDQIEKGETK